MKAERLVRPGTPIEVSILAIVAGVLSLGCLVPVIFPLAGDTPRVLMLGLAMGAASVAMALLVAAPRIRPPALHATVVLLVVLRGVMVSSAATERGLMLGAVGFVWTAVYAAFFFRADVARGYAALTTVVLGLSLLLASAPTDVTVWLTMVATVWVAVAVLTRLNARLRADARHDGLTGLLNRSGFALAAARERAAAQRRDEPVAVAVIDLDGFKEINDRHGHSAGDRVLVELAAEWTAALRPGDLLARFGGDEFVALFAAASEEQGHEILARLRLAHPAAWTAGATLWMPGETLDETIDRADRRLLKAKSERREACASASSVLVH